MYFRDGFLWLKLLLSKTLLLPFLTWLELRRVKPFEQGTLKAISRAIRSDKAHVRNVYKSSVKNYIALGMDFLFLARCSSRTRQKQLASTRVLGAEHLSEVLDSSRPILIISMYMGNFPLGFLKLMSEVKNKRKIFAFKFNNQTANETLLFSLFQNTSQDIEPLRAGEEGGKRAFLELRKGNIVAMVVDAEVHVTSRENVLFFGENCAMQGGPATLALLTKAVIVPIINYQDRHGQAVVQVESAIYPEKQTAAESPRQVIQCLTQAIAEQMEDWVQMAPQQVLRWSSLAHIMSHTPVESSMAIRCATPNDIPWLINHFRHRQQSSFLALSSIHGFSESELKVVLAGDHNTYVSAADERNFILSVQDVDIEHGQARMQFFCADESSTASLGFLNSFMKQHNLKRLTSFVFANEEKEISLLTALGFCQEAVFRQHVFLSGSYMDVIVYGRQEEWT